MFKKGDVVVAKDGFLDKGESLQDTAGLVVDYFPDNDYLVLGTLHPERFAIPPISSACGAFYRHITEQEKLEWNIA